jgi:hypothetical protein
MIQYSTILLSRIFKIACFHFLHIAPHANGREMQETPQRQIRTAKLIPDYRVVEL